MWLSLCVAQNRLKVILSLMPVVKPENGEWKVDD